MSRDKSTRRGGRPVNEYNPRISAYLKSLRARTGLRQVDVAKAVGVSERTYQNWEGTTSNEGRQVSEIYLSTAWRLMHILGGDLEHFARLYHEDIDVLEDEKPSAPDLATYLHERMEEATWTPAQMAAATGISENALREILAGKMPSALHAWQLARGLDISLDSVWAMMGLPADREGVADQAALLLQRKELLPVLQTLMQVPDAGLPAVRAYLIILAKQYAQLDPDDELSDPPGDQ